MSDRSTPPAPTSRRVLWAATGLIVLQLALRSWGAFTGWFQFDDIAFVSRILNQPFGWDLLFAPHNSHLMPGGFFLTWFNFELAEWSYWPFAVELILLQAVASVGVLVFLLSAFGRRVGILPPLALFLFTSFTLPADLWWAVGVNQTPTLAAFGWAGWTLLRYLRSSQLRWAVATAAITLVALAFQERALLLVPFYLFLTLAYFTTGDIVDRIVQAWKSYRNGILVVAGTCVAYVAFYAATALEFSPGRSQDQALMPLLNEMGLRGAVPAVFGGPIRWISVGVATGFPNPSELLVWACAGLAVYVSYLIARSRQRSSRAWWLIGVVFGAQVILVAASRSWLVGPQVGRDFRYLTELAVAIPFALALALMPLRQAPEQVLTTHASRFFDRPSRVTAAMALILAISTVSTVAFTHAWNDDRPGKPYFTHARLDLEAAKEPIALVDAPLPDPIFPGFGWGFPANMSSHLFAAWVGDSYFPRVATDELSIAAQSGRIKPARITPVRTGVGTSGCRLKLRSDRLEVPLNGPVLGIEWWVALRYTAAEDGTATLTAGDTEHTTGLLAGTHTLYFTAQGDGFDSISLTRTAGSGDLCVADLTLGRPYASGDEAPE